MLMLFRVVSVGMLLMFMATFGCGGSGGSHLASAGVVWDEDGITTRATGWIGQKTSTGSSLEIVALSKSEFGLAFMLSSPGGYLVPQDFDCSSSTDGSVIFTCTENQNPNLTVKVQSCLVSLTQVGEVGGANATGTFSAVVVRSDGKITQITNGSFNVPIQ
jgi:hypothetical protein